MKRRGGFTLIEMLVAMAILALVVTLLASMFGSISGAWISSREKMDNFAKGRALINAIHRDLKNAVVRSDLSAFPSNASDSQLAFYTRQFGVNGASASQRPLTFVSYSLVETNGSRFLFRSDASHDFVSNRPNWTTNSPTPSSDNNLCSGVYAFHYDFLQQDGSVGAIFRPASQSNSTRAIRVGVAILSESAERTLKTLNGEALLVNELEAAIPSDGSSLKVAWDSQLLSSLSHKFPAQVLGGIRTYEHVTAVARQ